MKLFFDTEFTGLHQRTTIISLGIVDENDCCFYAEFTDYRGSQVTDWIKQNVLSNLTLGKNTHTTTTDNVVKCVGTTEYIQKNLLQWLSRYSTDGVEFWSDCLAYDWVLLNGVIANYDDGYPKLPSYINYIPFDLATVFKIKGINPDISRKEFSGMSETVHNALSDAKMIKRCYEILEDL